MYNSFKSHCLWFISCLSSGLLFTLCLSFLRFNYFGTSHSKVRRPVWIVLWLWENIYIKCFDVWEDILLPFRRIGMVGVKLNFSISRWISPLFYVWHGTFFHPIAFRNKLLAGSYSHTCSDTWNTKYRWTHFPTTKQELKTPGTGFEEILTLTNYIISLF